MASRGAVTLRSADPHRHPSIVLNYLKEEADRRNLIDPVRHTDEIIQQQSFDKIRGGAIVLHLPKKDDAEVLAKLKENMDTQYHPCSSCRMGEGACRWWTVRGAPTERTAYVSSMHR